MLRRFLGLISSRFQNHSPSTNRKLSAAVLETLEQRRLLSTTSSLDIPSGVLTVDGDSSANSIVLDTSSGTLTVKDGTTTINSYSATNVTSIVVNANDGND